MVRAIPRGRVSSYGAIAACLGSKGSSRVVGYAMNASHRVKPPVPAHRVVNRNGLLSGKMHFSTPTEMEEKLRKEGVVVKNDRVQDFETRFWDPGKELQL